MEVSTRRRGKALLGAATSALLVASGLMLAPTVANAAEETVSSGSLTWGFKQSWRNYVTGPIANGDISAVTPATEADNFVTWVNGSGTVDAEAGTGTITYEGGMLSQGHNGLGPNGGWGLNQTLNAAQIEITSTTTATISAEVTQSAYSAWPEMTGERVPLAELTFAEGDLDDGEVSSAAATLTEEGHNVYVIYPTGDTTLDPVSFNFEVEEAPAPEADPKISVTPSEDLDPAVENTITVEGTGYVGDGAAMGAYVLFGEKSVWSGEGPLPGNGWIAQQWVRANQITDGGFSTTLTIPAGTLDPEKEYQVATSAAHALSATDRSLDAFQDVTVAQPAPEPATDTDTSLVASAETVDEGDEVTLTATVDPAEAAGAITFSSNGDALAEPVTVEGGTAELTTDALPAGENSIIAGFTPADEAEFSASASEAVTVTVNAKAEADPKITVTPSEDLDPAVENTITVEGTGYVGDGAANGAYVVFGEKSIWSGEGPLPSQGWIAMEWVPAGDITDGAFSTTLTVPEGTLDPEKEYHVATSAAHALSATNRTLDAFHDVTVKQPVSEAVDTTTTLEASAEAIDEGEEITFTAAVAPAEAAGTVTFSTTDGALGEPVEVQDGAAELKTTELPAGENSIIAGFTPADAEAYNASTSEAVTVTVTGAETPEVIETTTELATGAEVGDDPKDVEFVATVSPDAAPGSVTFTNNGEKIGTVAVENGVARVTTDLVVGENRVQAAFTSGDERYSDSVSEELVVTVSGDEKGDGNVDGVENGGSGDGKGKGGLANTGSNGLETGLLFGGAVILLGAASLLLARRRTAAHSE